MNIGFFRLLQKHQRIDQDLQGELARRWPDLIRIRKLKKLKLAIKDRLHAASRTREASPA